MEYNSGLKGKIPQTGDEICLEISGLNHQGMGIGRFHGPAIFIKGALPREIVKAKIIKTHKKYAIGKLLEIIKESPDRISPPCPYFGACGGCSLQHILYKEQLKFKKQRLKDSLERIGGIKNPNIEDVMASPKEFYYRNRGRFHIFWEENGLKLGYFEYNAQNIINIKKCLIVDEEINKILFYLQKHLPEYRKGLGGLYQIAIQSNSRGEIGLIFMTKEDNPAYRELALALLKNFPKIIYIAANIRKAKAPARSITSGGEWRHLAGDKALNESYNGLSFALSPGSFSQVNRGQTLNLYAKIKEYAALGGEETVLDIYCGVGAIALYLAPFCRRVMGVEESKTAIINAKSNALANGIENAEFFAAPAEEILPLWAEQGLKPQVIVVDPPRQGCNEAVISAIAAMEPGKIIYVSCDPATLARDLRILNTAGYKIKKTLPFDMFPQTGHVETVVLMSRADK